MGGINETNNYFGFQNFDQIVRMEFYNQARAEFDLEGIPELFAEPDEDGLNIDSKPSS
ncbi:MAG TPA: hypothetical protein VLG76_08275 [Rhabdochlamydiaceae bacterium]|nr:hypothetical protein [Rhabdochlamydiaceae bacterium]